MDEPPKITKKTDKSTVYKRYEELIEDMGQATQDLVHVAAQASAIADWTTEFSRDQISDMSKQEKADESDRAMRRSEEYWEDKSFGPRSRYEKLKREFDGDANMKYVQQALDFQMTHGNELSSALLANCKRLAELGDFRDQVLTAPIKLSLPSSTRFVEDDADGFSHLSIKTADYENAEHTVDVSAKLGLSGLIKMVSFGLEGGVETHSEQSDTSFNNMEVEFDVGFVNIIRPWMDATLFSKHVHWDAGGNQKKGSVSSGNKQTQDDSKLLPYIPMQMIVAKNVKLKADWSQEHKKLFEQAAQGGFSIGWGPFKIGPSMNERTSDLKEDRKTGESFLDIPGIQCIGFVSWVPPFSAPYDGEHQAATLDKRMVSGDTRIQEDASQLVDQFSQPPHLREARYQQKKRGGATG